MTDPTPSADYWQIPALPTDDRLVGGVASGIAREVGVDPLWIRLSFVGLFAIGGWGGLLYLIAWGGLSFAHYRGYVPQAPATPKGSTPRRRAIGVALVVGGIAVLVGQLGGIAPSVLWPLGVMAGGVLVALQRISPDETRWLPGWFPSAQIIGGIVVALGAIAAVQAFGITGGSSTVLVVASVAIGLVVLSAPWWWQLITELDAERQARARADERAEVAAHLHDSVLQTLMLIQKGDNTQEMMNLARRQERELRNWLDPNRASRSGGSVRGQLDQMATEVEELHGVAVEVVTVGDALLDPPTEAIIAAAREAVVNGAKHSGAPRIDVYAEMGEQQIDIYVRDTGCGFEVDGVSADRRGLRESIVGRMERVGGSATIHSTPADGTEIELTVPRDNPASDNPASDNPAPENTTSTARVESEPA